MTMAKWYLSIYQKEKYLYHEFDAPSGYKLDEGYFEFEIKEDGQIVKATMTNERMDGSLPQTGDTAGKLLVVFGALLIGSGIALVMVMRRKKKIIFN